MAIPLASIATPQTAQDVLARAREAIGGEARLRELRTLSFDASVETTEAIRAMRNGTERRQAQKSRLRVKGDFLLPDQFRVTCDFEGGTRTVDGSDGRPMVLKYASATGHGCAPFAAFADNDAVIIAFRQDPAVHLVSWLLLAAPPQFSDAGEVQTTQGPADAVDVAGLNQFAARLLFDKTTHRLLMSTWQAIGAAPPAAPSGTQPATAQTGMGRLLFKGIEGPAAPPAQISIQPSDYRLEKGILLPHRLTTIGPATVETWKIRFKVDEPIDPRIFERPKQL